MQAETVKRLIEQAIPNSTVQVANSGNKYEVMVVSDAFAGKTPVAAHKLVYSALNDHIDSGEIHALSIRTFTPDNAPAGHSTQA